MLQHNATFAIMDVQEMQVQKERMIKESGTYRY